MKHTKVTERGILISISIFLICISSLFSDAKADTFQSMDKNEKHFYKGCIFTTSDLTGDRKSEAIVQIPGEKNLFILRWNGIWFRKVGEIETPFEKINDVAVGDVDNDGMDEIALISGKELYIFEKEGNRFILDTTKTTPLYGENRFGRKEALESVNKFYKGQIDPVTDRKLSPQEIEGKLVRIGDVYDDKTNAVLITKMFDWVRDEIGYAYIVDILKWNGKHFELKSCCPAKIGTGEMGVVINDLDNGGGNDMITAGNNGVVMISYKYDKVQELFQGFLGLSLRDERQEAEGLRMNIGRIDGEKVLIYCFNTKRDFEGIDENVVKYFTIRDDTFPQLKKTIHELPYEDSFVKPKDFPRYGIKVNSIGKIEGVKQFVFGNLDKDQENELIVNAAAGAYIYGLKFNVVLIISIVVGVILVLALALFLFIRTRRKKKAATV